MRTRKHEIVNLNTDVSSAHSGSLLARFYRTILKDIGVDDERFHAIMARYVRYGEMAGTRDARESLDRELLRIVITWKTFCKGLEPLKVKQAIFLTRLWVDDVVDHCKYAAVIYDPLLDKPGEVLSKLLTQIFFELEIYGERYDRLISDYILRSKSIVHKREKSSIRAALSKELFSAKDITWRSFVKGVDLAALNKVDFIAELHYSKVRRSRHQLTFSSGGMDD